MTVLQIVKVSSKPPMMSFQCPYDVIPVPKQQGQHCKFRVQKGYSSRTTASESWR
ncbi:hypothetical protein [Wolbachia endosymbiont (group A) of Philonthus cognatus]|uniref:hypothetical protein n=1 Tax=Wolbachia endosymbiont (group A) of Philonthus cognatus TaxID=2954046 RepID=UPI0022316C4A|nr:hypothetical protein [Wolbachia endosymbiont (group A) of Philonthus cognatus]